MGLLSFHDMDYGGQVVSSVSSGPKGPSLNPLDCLVWKSGNRRNRTQDARLFTVYTYLTMVYSLICRVILHLIVA